MVRLAERAVEAIIKGKYSELGELVDQSWRIKSGLSSAVSTEKASELYALARLKGARGGKLTGAGGGGCLVLVAPPEKRTAIVAALEERGALHIPFSFEFDGSAVIFADRRSGCA